MPARSSAAAAVVAAAAQAAAQQAQQALARALADAKRGLPLRTVEAFARAHRHEAVGALDVGTVHVGAATSWGPHDATAFDGPPLRRDKGHFGDLVAALKAAWQPRQVRGVVVGYPLLLSGQEGEQCLRTLKFLRTLLNPTHGLGIASVVLLDERLSTQDVKQALHGAGMKAGAMRAHGLDHLVARELLLQYLAQAREHYRAGSNG